MAKKARLPTDVNARAKGIVDLATSEEPLPDPDEEKDPAAIERGKRGGAARSAALTPSERSEIARAAAEARWRRATRD